MPIIYFIQVTLFSKLISEMWEGKNQSIEQSVLLSSVITFKNTGLGSDLSSAEMCTLVWIVALWCPPGQCPLFCQPQPYSHWWRLRAVASDWLVWTTLSLLWSVLPHLYSQQNFTWSLLLIREKWNRRRKKSFSN